MAKAAAKKSASKSSPVKYSDKSAGQPGLTPIFDQVKKLCAAYAKGHLMVRGEGPGQYHIWSDKSVEVAGRLRNDICFVGLMIQKGYVGFYFMPVYTNPALKERIAPELLASLKGKSCFHLKKNDPVMMGYVKDALKEGFADYKKRGWV